MDILASPASSKDTFADDDWDLLSNKSEPGRASPVLGSTAGDFDSDGDVPPHPVDDIADLASDISTCDELESADEEPAEDALIRESDRRVNAALANSLESTLDPFREPLPSSISGSMSGSEGSGFILSFPDPLTPSQELQAAALLAADVPLDLPPSSADQDNVQDIAEARQLVDVPVETEDDRQAAPIAAVELAAEKEPIFPIIVEEYNAGDLRKIASYIPRKQDIQRRPSNRRRLSGGVVPLLSQGPPISHSWTTSIMVSIVAIVLGSALYGTRSYMATTPSVAVPMTPSPPIIPLTSGVASLPEVRYSAEAPTTLLQTPGAGPSSLSTAALKAQASTTTKDGKNPVDVGKPATEPEAASRACGYTRPGPATPPSIRSGFWSTKGKEKEVIEVDVPEQEMSADDGSEKPLLLEGPRTPLTLGYIYQDVLKGVKAVLGDLPLKSLSTDLVLSTVNFEELLDELIARLLSQTSTLLSELTSAVNTAEAVIVSQAESLLSSGPVQNAKKAFVEHHRRVKSNTRKIVRRVKKHHRRVRSNARKVMRTVKEKDVPAFVRGVRAHHERVKSNTIRGRKMMRESLMAVVGGGHRLLTETFGSMECDQEQRGEAMAK